MLNRRDWILTSAAAAATVTSSAAQQPGNRKPVVISSANGLAACAKAREMIASGADTLDAVIAGVNINELDPNDTSVGYGGLPNEEGVVELDSCVMHGPSRRCGSVASIRNIKTPSKVAKLVMEQTDHIMLVGDGALRFAKACGFQEENLLTEKSRLAWLVWKQSLRDSGNHNNWGVGLDAPPGTKIEKPGYQPTAQIKEMFPHATDEDLAWASQVAASPITG